MSKNLGTPFLLRFIRIDPRLSWQLILISVYLCLIGLANTAALLGIIQSGDNTAVTTTVASTALHLIPAYGLLALRPWGRLLEIGISGIALAIAVALVFSVVGVGGLIGR